MIKVRQVIQAIVNKGVLPTATMFAALVTPARAADQLTVLHEYLTDGEGAAVVATLDDHRQYLVLVSASDGVVPAQSFTGSGSNWLAGLTSAISACRQWLEQEGLTARFVRADFVTDLGKVDFATLQREYLEYCTSGNCPYGIGLDENLKRAWLPAQIKALKLINYDNANTFLLTPSVREVLGETGELRYYPFHTQGFFCGDGQCATLVSDNTASNGQRRVETDVAGITEALQAITQHLLDVQKNDGGFIYGTWVQAGRAYEDSAEQVRLAGLGALLSSYYLGVQPAPNVLVSAKEGIDYLIGLLVQDEVGRLYAVDSKGKSIQLDGNALLAISIIDYLHAGGESLDVSTQNYYLQVAARLLQGATKDLTSDGHPAHILYYNDAGGENFVNTGKKDGYYDGEIALALLQMYGLTGERLYLQQGEMILNMLIREQGFVCNRSHWYALALSEVIKYDPQVTYLEQIVVNARQFVSGNCRSAEGIANTYDGLTQTLDRGLAVDDGGILAPLQDKVRDVLKANLLRVGRPEITMFWPNGASFIGSNYDSAYLLTRIDLDGHLLSALLAALRAETTLANRGQQL